MSERGDSGPSKASKAQEQALREMLRQRELNAARPDAPQQPPDLAEVFGKLFGLFKAGQGDDANRQRARKQAASDAPSARLGRWREEVNSRLQAARARLEEMSQEQQAQAAPASSAGFAPPDAPAPRPAAEHAEPSLRSAGSAVLASKRVGRATSRRTRLRQQLNDPSRIRELLLANELLGPPLSRRSRERR